MGTTETEKKLTLEEVVTKIKGLISKSALAKIEIGELLFKHTEAIKHGDKEAFYKNINMSDRTAQYYMNIASNKEVQKLKKEGKLDGLNMTQILKLVGMRVNIRGVNNDDAPEEEYKVLGLGKFNYNKCRSTKQFKAEYEVLKDRVTELEEKLRIDQVAS